MPDNRPSNYNYFDVNATEFRINISTLEEVEKWVTEFSELTKVTWQCTTTAKTPLAKSRKNILRRYYHCHFNVKRSRSTKNSRNIDCPAKMKIVLEKHGQMNSASLWPCVVTVTYEHNHTIVSGAALLKRPVGDDTRKEILDLFEKGHSAASAYHTFIAKKMEELGDDYEDFVLDRYVCPTKTDFSNLWAKHFKNNYGDRTGEAMLQTLENNLRKNKVTTSRILRIQEHYAVCLCTPIMQRAAQHLIQSSEILFVDATGNCDVQNHKIYFFATQSPAGGVPVGCIIASSQKEEVFDRAVSSFIEIMPTKIKPKIILTDDDLTERHILNKYWPESKLCLCSFHVLKAVWKWLGAAKNRIKKTDRQAMYKTFKNILMSKTEKEVNVNIDILFEKCVYPQFAQYIIIHYLSDNKIKAWCLYYRQKCLSRGSDTNNYIEVMFRLFKDIPLERTKAFNLNQLVDFVITNFETYYKQRLLDVVLNRERKSTLKRLLPDEKNVSLNTIERLSFTEYNVNSASGASNLTYFVDMASGICTCPQGCTGKLCKHQSAVIKKFGIENVVNTLTIVTRKQIYEIATGVQPSVETFAPLKLSDIVENNLNSANNDTAECVQNNDSNEGDDARIETIIQVTNEDVKDVKQEWEAFSKRLMDHLEDDPAGFCPAIKKFISNSQVYAHSASSLMSGMYTAFKYKGIFPKQKKSIFRKGKKISVQPTSVSQRKSTMTGRRNLSAGRKANKTLVKKKPTAPHTLQKCVNRNIGLGENKFKK